MHKGACCLTGPLTHGTATEGPLTHGTATEGPLTHDVATKDPLSLIAGQGPC